LESLGEVNIGARSLAGRGAASAGVLPSAPDVR